MKQYPFIYIKVDVNDRLPTTDGFCPCILNTGEASALYYSTKYKEWSGAGLNMNNIVTHWLEKQDSSIVCSLKDLERIWDEAQDQQEAKHSPHRLDPTMFFDEYISKVINP